MQTLIRKIKQRKAKVVVIGLGYVGLPLAVEKAKAGFKVVGIERKKDRVDKVNRGENYISDVLEIDLKKVVREGKLRATQSFEPVKEADVITICVPTPLDKNKSPDTRYIKKVTLNLLPWVKKGQLFILESTSYPGTTEEIILPCLRRKGLKVGEDFFLAFSPERVDPGNKKYRTINTPKVVGGVTARCSEVAKIFYQEIIQEEVFVVSSPRVAEMEKLLENIFRIVNISLVNELALLCEEMGIDIWEVIEAAKTKPFGFMPFYPGPGLGGHCIPLDPFYLSWKAKEYGFSTRFIELAGEINENMPRHVVERISQLLNKKEKPLKGSLILMLGVAYKKNVDDVRESPALKIFRILKERGARVFYHDPWVPMIKVDGEKYYSRKLTPELLQKSDLVLITTGHTNVDYRKVVENTSLIYDTRNALKGFRSPKIYRLGSWSEKEISER